MAKIYYRYGAMNSGKTTNMLQVAYNYEERDQKVILIKPEVDKKGGNCVVSRLGVKREVDYMIKQNQSIIETIKNHLYDINCLLVDEVQFLTEEHIFELFVIAKKYDIPVIAYGLKIDFKTNTFPGSLGMFRFADEFQEMETICRCGQNARFNARLVKGEFVSEGNQVAIDELDDVSYESLCGKCYLEKVINYKDDIKVKKKNKSNN